MNFNVYLNSKLGEALKRLAKRRTMTCNALIRQAVENLVAGEGETRSWSTAVLEWRGDPAFEPFESHRNQLRSAAHDPLA